MGAVRRREGKPADSGGDAVKTLYTLAALFALIVALLHIEVVEDFCMKVLCSEWVERRWGD